MGASATAHSACDTRVPEDAAGIAAFADEVLVFASSGRVEIWDKSGIAAARTLSVAPTCAAATAAGTYAVGFANGAVSEFDAELNLLMTFAAPGRAAAHCGPVAQLAASAGCHVASIGGDRAAHLWSAGGSAHTISGTARFTAVCCSDGRAWLADERAAVTVVDLVTKAVVAAFDVPARITRMSLIGSRGCIAAAEDCAALVLSAGSVIANMPYRGGAPLADARVLHADPSTGLLTYAGVDQSGAVVLRALEHTQAELGSALPFLAESEGAIVAIVDRRIVRMPVRELAARSLRDLPEMELPRTRVRDFLAEEEM